MAKLNANEVEEQGSLPSDATGPKLDAILVFNGRSYDNSDGRNDGRGWTIFEQGAAMTTAAHLARAERQAARLRRPLPDRLVEAQATRAKLIDISAGLQTAGVVREPSGDPEGVLRLACAECDVSTWYGNKAKVCAPRDATSRLGPLSHQPWPPSRTSLWPLFGTGALHAERV